MPTQHSFLSVRVETTLSSLLPETLLPYAISCLQYSQPPFRIVPCRQPPMFCFNRFSFTCVLTPLKLMICPTHKPGRLLTLRFRRPGTVPSTRTLLDPTGDYIYILMIATMARSGPTPSARALSQVTFVQGLSLTVLSHWLNSH